MRISDWSSACALPIWEDLHAGGVERFLVERLVRDLELAHEGHADLLHHAAGRGVVLVGLGEHGGGAASEALAVEGKADRKSVVWGKSVAVSVDLGGRRTLKKKK